MNVNGFIFTIFVASSLVCHIFACIGLNNSPPVSTLPTNPAVFRASQAGLNAGQGVNSGFQGPPLQASAPLLEPAGVATTNNFGGGSGGNFAGGGNNFGGANNFGGGGNNFGGANNFGGGAGRQTFSGGNGGGLSRGEHNSFFGSPCKQQYDCYNRSPAWRKRIRGYNSDGFPPGPRPQSDLTQFMWERNQPKVQKTTGAVWEPAPPVQNSAPGPTLSRPAVNPEWSAPVEQSWDPPASNWQPQQQIEPQGRPIWEESQLLQRTQHRAEVNEAIQPRINNVVPPRNNPHVPEASSWNHSPVEFEELGNPRTHVVQHFEQAAAPVETAPLRHEAPVNFGASNNDLPRPQPGGHAGQYCDSPFNLPNLPNDAQFHLWPQQNEYLSGESVLVTCLHFKSGATRVKYQPGDTSKPFTISGSTFECQDRQWVASNSKRPVRRILCL